MDPLFLQLKEYAENAKPFLVEHDYLLEFLLVTKEDAQAIEEKGYDIRPIDNNEQLLLSSSPLQWSVNHFYSSNQ